MLKVVLKFHDKNNPSQEFFPGDLIVVVDEERRKDLLSRGIVVEAIPTILKEDGMEIGEIVNLEEESDEKSDDTKSAEESDEKSDDTKSAEESDEKSDDTKSAEESDEKSDDTKSAEDQVTETPSDEQEPSNEGAGEVKMDYSKMSAKEVKELLAEKGIAFDQKAKKDELLKLLEG